MIVSFDVSHLGLFTPQVRCMKWPYAVVPEEEQCMHSTAEAYCNF